jgi:hypothetical protein
MNAFFSNYNYLPEVEFMKDHLSFKISMVFDEPFEKCLNLVKFLINNLIIK